MYKKDWIILIIGMILLSLLIGGCSVKYQPIVDPRVSENYADITRDIVECKELTEDLETHWLSCTRPLGESTCNKKLKQCLIARGHSVLN